MNKDKSICTFVSAYNTHTKILYNMRTKQEETISLLKSNEGFGTTSIKDLLLSMPNVGEDEDFARHQDLGRECDALFD